jgi:hypothetical protein
VDIGKDEVVVIPKDRGRLKGYKPLFGIVPGTIPGFKKKTVL